LETLKEDFPDREIVWGITLLANREPDVVIPLCQHPNTQHIHVLDGEPAERFHRPETFKVFQKEVNPKVQWHFGGSPSTFSRCAVSANTLKILTGSLYTAGALLASSPDN
jgi:folylpolyglutamate synthase/dihydropteroate synthase